MKKFALLLSLLLMLVFIGSPVYARKLMQDNNDVKTELTSLKVVVSDELKEKVKETGSLMLSLGVIPGALYGGPIEGAFWGVDLNALAGPAINLRYLEKEVAKYAQSHERNDKNSFFKVKPATTRFLRISTYGYDVEAGTFLTGGLRNETADPVILAYFDRPCTVKGEISSEQGIFIHQFSIPKAGLYHLVQLSDGQIYRIKPFKTVEQLEVVVH
ncbi:MAG: hypothetical protein GKR93_04520 [Gammaproteobacteria bacterium]|nr:hypothetical protein [Gammaproteobacteria bacterium]